MIGVVIVTHGRLGREFLSALEHVVGAQEQIRTICIVSDDDTEQRRNEIIESVKDVDDGNGVVILTDMFGGTPSNLAISLMDQGKIEVIAGINLPMLIKLASARQEGGDFHKVIEQACQAGRKYINTVSSILKEDEDG